MIDDTTGTNLGIALITALPELSFWRKPSASSALNPSIGLFEYSIDQIRWQSALDVDGSRQEDNSIKSIHFQKNMEFKASLDTLAKIITLGVTVLFIALGQQSLRELLMAKGNTTTILVHAGILLLFIAILLISWLYAPQSYTMDDTNLVINRAIGKVWIKLADIAQVRAVEPHEMIGTIRTFGVGGLFGYFGLYYNTKIGKTTLYTTQRQNRVLITTNQGQKIILSPDDLGMVEKIKSTL